MFKDLINVRSEAGAPVEIHPPQGKPLTVIPTSQAVTLRFPYVTWVWNRPIAVEVSQGQESKRIVIWDITRIVQFGLFGLAFLFSAIALINSDLFTKGPLLDL